MLAIITAIRPPICSNGTATKWVKITDWIAPMKEKVRPMLEAAAKDYVSKNQPWPKRTEPCEKSS